MSVHSLTHTQQHINTTPQHTHHTLCQSHKHNCINNHNLPSIIDFIFTHKHTIVIMQLQHSQHHSPTLFLYHCNTATTTAHNHTHTHIVEPIHSHTISQHTDTNTQLNIHTLHDIITHNNTWIPLLSAINTINNNTYDHTHTPTQHTTLIHAHHIHSWINTNYTCH